MYNSIDKEIVLDMSASEDTKHYRRYLTDRFVVEDIHDTGMGFCAVIKDMEMGMGMKLLTGEQKMALFTIHQEQTWNPLFFPISKKWHP